MVSTTVSRCSAVCFVMCYAYALRCHALVVNTPTLDGNGFVTTETSSPETKIERSMGLDLRIRSAHESDVNEIADMLTYALLEGDAEERDVPKKHQFFSPPNFKFRNIRKGVAPLLQSRITAIETGGNVVHNYLAKGTLDNLNEADQLRLLWDNDSFRQSVEKAASLSNEPHIWKDHNFACAPQSFNWLFHKMVTAENVHTGDIIGFCEVAILSKPSEGDSSDTGTYDEECRLVDNEPGIPTIVNLVTSADHRRRGVGTTLLNSVLNYVQRSSPTWNEMALYVEEGNTRAIKMYERFGFQKRKMVHSKKQWYMTRQICSGKQEEQSIANIKTLR